MSIDHFRDFQDFNLIQDDDASDEPLVLVCEARKPAGQSLADLCRACGVNAAAITEGEGLLTMLHYMQPAAVISEMVLADQDGFNVMKGVATYNRHLPMLIVTGGDPILRGAAEAIEEIWGMTHAWTLDTPAAADSIGRFLAQAVSPMRPALGRCAGPFARFSSQSRPLD